MQADAELPIAAHAQEIIELVQAHQVVVVAGETGSGKTTQLPKLCLAAGRGQAGLIGCTQPRRIAARTVAQRVASELGGALGGQVGYQVRFEERTSDDMLVKFMTDGILLAETQTDRWLSQYDTLIIDEAHERSLNIDFLLGYLKRLLARRADLKVIITSATIDTARFSEHFGNAPVVEVEGRSWPVEVRWRPPAEDDDVAAAAQVAAAVDDITHEDAHGDILVFLPGEREIRDTDRLLSWRGYRNTRVLPLYARLASRSQDEIFQPGRERRIVLATNVAETSLTVPRIRYVIDSGTARVKRYSQRNQLERLHIEPISQAAAEQRKGRCGRVGPGVCVRLYAEDDFAQRPEYTDPEILRSSLAGVILRMLVLGLGDVASFPFLQAPEQRAIADGYRRLFEVQAIDGQQRLTAQGRTMGRFPMDVTLARMLVEAERLKVLPQVLAIVSFLSIQDPRERPAEARAQADAAQAVFRDRRSDFLTILNLFHDWQHAHASLTRAQLRQWSRDHFLSFARMHEWRELRRQLLLICAEMGWQTRTPTPQTPPPGGEEREKAHEDLLEPLHRSLLSGWPTQVGRKDEKGDYEGARQRRFSIFPGSSLAKTGPQWLLAGQLLDIGRIYAMNCARVQPLWIEQQAAHLLKRSWRDPHWSQRRGNVLAFEQVSLFGLVLVEKRTVTLGRHDPQQAHAIFLQALADAQVSGRARFLAANAAVLEEAHELEARQRRSGLLRDSEERVQWLAERIPADIHSAAGLDAWYRKLDAPARKALEWSLADVLHEEQQPSSEAFPPSWTLAAHSLPLEYHFAPGDEADGVTLSVPLELVSALPRATLDWLVPGLVEEKVTALLRGLPRALRRNFVPVPDFARAFLETAPDTAQPLTAQLARYLQRITGVTIDAQAFTTDELPAHLRLRLRIVDEQGRELAAGRDLDALIKHWSVAAREAFSEAAASDMGRDDVSDFDFDELPPSIETDAGLRAFPALVDLQARVALQVLADADEAAKAHAGGVARLLRYRLAREIKQAERKLPLDERVAMRWSSLGPLRALREDLVESALAQLLADADLQVRSRQAFKQLRDGLARRLFGVAVEQMQRAEAVISAWAELQPLLEPPLMGFATANYDDLREQLAGLVQVDMFRTMPAERLQHIPRYLQAMQVRARRLRDDPQADQQRMLTISGYWQQYLELAQRLPANAEVEELRWQIEELRVSVFAQQLGTAQPVSAKRLTRAIEALQQLNPPA